MTRDVKTNVEVRLWTELLSTEENDAVKFKAMSLDNEVAKRRKI